MLKKRYFTITLLVVACILLLMGLMAVFNLLPVRDSDLPSMKKAGKIRMVTSFNPIGYFFYKDEPLGFEYELLKAFADSLNLELEVVQVNNPADFYDVLYRGEGDIMAYHIPVENLPAQFLHFSEPYVQTEQVIVQRKAKKKDPYHIPSWEYLAGKTITLAEGAHYTNTLQNLNFELGNKINIETLEGGRTTEDLIGMVAAGELDYTVANKEIALINRGYYDNIDIETSITPPQDIAFVVHRKHRKLLRALNEFIAASRANGSMYALYDRYFKTSRLYADAPQEQENDAGKGEFISAYDGLVQKYAEEIGWDWRLVSALIWQESRFKPRARSWAGATGLMQLMPATARRFGLMTLQEIYEPELNVKTGTAYLAWLDNFWKEIEDPIERLKFVMASYNAGEGHVKDAQRLAVKYGYESKKWDGQVEYFLLNKSQPQFYRDPICKYGYCRGSEPFHYVRAIIKRYDHYKQTVASKTSRSYDFNLNFSPVVDMGISQDGRIEKRALFRDRQLFQERALSRESAADAEGKYHNTLQPKPAFQRADTIIPKSQGLQPKKPLFEEKQLFKP